MVRWLCIIALLFLAHLAGANGRSTDCAIFVAAALIILAQPANKRDRP